MTSSPSTRQWPPVPLFSSVTFRIIQIVFSLLEPQFNHRFICHHARSLQTFSELRGTVLYICTWPYKVIQSLHLHKNLISYQRHQETKRTRVLRTARRNKPRKKKKMGVQHLLKLRMASPHPHPHPGAPLAARPLSALASFFLARPSSTAAAPPPQHVTLSCPRSHCNHNQWAASRCRGTAGRRRLQGVVAMSSSAPSPPPGSVQKSEEEWEAILSPEQFRILRLKGTE